MKQLRIYCQNQWYKQCHSIHKKLQPKHAWKVGDFNRWHLHLVMSNFGTVGPKSIHWKVTIKNCLELSELEPLTFAFDNVLLWNRWVNFKVFYMKTAWNFLPKPERRYYQWIVQKVLSWFHVNYFAIDPTVPKLDIFKCKGQRFKSWHFQTIFGPNFLMDTLDDLVVTFFGILWHWQRLYHLFWQKISCITPWNWSSWIGQKILLLLWRL